MIRFRNPVSDINVILNVFKSLYSEFSNVEFFDLDNIAEFLAREKLASSSGYTGDEALKRSYLIKDDSRKSMKMQAKSYTEIYRTLGWIHSKEDVALNFTFTYLGVHVAMSGSASKDLFTQCLLGIIYPNKNLDVKFNDINKPFVSILKFAFLLDGKINRDEILLGPMNLSDGKDQIEIDNKIEEIKKLRKTKKLSNLNLAIENLSNELSMQPTSVRNLTRFVISSLDFSGWFVKEKLNIYGKKSDFLVLTDKGREAYNQIQNSIDLYERDLELVNNLMPDIFNYSFLQMLKNADFNVQHDLAKFSELKELLNDEFGCSDVLFSPFQYFSQAEISEYLPDKILVTSESNIETNVEIDELGTLVYYESNKSISHLQSEKTSNETIEKIIEEYFKDGLSLDKSLDDFLDDVAIMKQTDFYPLVADMLSFIFEKKATTPQAGNNNLRYDVIIEDNVYSIPVEVKSPTEEVMLSVKAIRQALENKVILLSRKPYNSTYEICSMAIGYKVPNKRSDVYQLIEDIFNTYKINIAITDMRDLATAVVYCYKCKTSFNISDFNNYRGRIEFNYENL